MGGLLSDATNKRSEPTEEDRVMASLTIPVLLEKNLALGDGTTEGGCPIVDALQFDQDKVSNLYTTTGDELTFAFQEHGVAYDETNATDYLVEATVKLGGAANQPSLTLDSSPLQMWGVNFAGRVLVRHKSGEERVIYLPGTRTYDPAGLTGDPHASERIGPSCSRTQTGITLTELVAAQRGADLAQVTAMHDKIRPAVKRYHGREVLFDWMKLQVEEAVYNNADVTPYPEYIKSLIRRGDFDLNKSREHTRAYLESYNRGLAHPPLQYYQKVAKKDKVDEILTEEDAATFKKMVTSN